MTLTYRLKNKSLHIFAGLVFLLSIFPIVVSAQSTNSLSLSVSPTLYEMTANPGQIWQSTLKVINPNPYELTLYANVVNFEPRGETGQPRFLPLDEANQAETLAGWIQVADEAIIVPPEQTLELPFVIDVPESAPPGGHFAAVLVGTKPPENSGEVPQLETAQIVTSLVFLRVSGNVNEAGQVRSFRSTKQILNTPETTFELRFENTGNVHLLPQGSITITNMWGQERGVIPVNSTSLFGQVLPDQVRKFTYNWKGQWSIADIGRYTAEATVAYGEEGRKFASLDTHFWVIPWKPLLLIFFVLGIFIFLITTLIRWYIRRMFTLAGVTDVRGSYEPGPKMKTRKAVTYTAPLEKGMLDLRRQFHTHRLEHGWISSLLATVKNNSKLLAIVVGVVICLSLIIWFISNALQNNRSYEVEIFGPNESVTITSEDIAYEAAQQGSQTEQNPATSTATTSAPGPTIQIVNRSGVSGLAAAMRIQLESDGVTITDLATELDETERNTVIVYTPDYAAQALELSGQIANALLSSYVPTEEDAFDIVIYVGSDYESEVE